MCMSAVLPALAYEEKHGGFDRDIQVHVHGGGSNGRSEIKLEKIYDRINVLEKENAVLRYANKKAIDYIDKIKSPSHELLMVKELLTIN